MAEDAACSPDCKKKPPAAVAGQRRNYAKVMSTNIPGEGFYSPGQLSKQTPHMYAIYGADGPAGGLPITSFYQIFEAAVQYK